MYKFLLTFLLTMSLTLGFAQDHIIEVSNNIYTPANLTITQGESVEWVNLEGSHNVNGDQGTYPGNPESFGNGAASSMAWTYEYTFTVPGTYSYQCDPHVGFGMVGTIIVEAGVVTGDLVISGIFDAQPSGAGAKGFELYAVNNIPNLADFGVGSANNGGGSDGEEFSFPSMAVSAGDCIYVAADSALFNDFFGFFPNFTGGAANINGDDAIELFEFGVVIDVVGDINTDGSGEVWDHLDGWVYRNDGTPANMGTFDPGTFTYSGINVLDGEATNAGAAMPFPSCTYSSVPPTMIATNDDAVTTDQDVPVTLDVLVNDVLPNGWNSLDILSNGANGGAAVVAGSSNITYTPNAGFCGMDNFTYQVCDNTMMCESGLVTVTVNCPTNYTVASVGDASVIDADGVLTTIDQPYELTGIVHGIDLQGDNPVQFTFIDATGGLGLFSNQSFGYTVTEGDEVTVRGVMSQFNGLAQINPDTIIFNSSGNPLNIPTEITALSEATESELVKFANPVTIDPADWEGDGSSFNVTTLDGHTIRIDNDTDLANMATLPAYTFFVTGIGGQFDNSVPHDEGYQLFPRYMADLDFDVSTNEAVWANDIEIFPNPATEVITIKADLQFDEIRVTNVIGEDVITLQNANEVSVKALSNGAYFITFLKDGEMATKRFVKQ